MWHTLALQQVLLKVIANSLRNYSEREDILQEEPRGFRPQRSTIDMIFVVRRLHQFARKKSSPLDTCFVNLAKAYDSVDRTLLWTMIARFGIPPKTLAALRHFHDGMLARIRTDDGERSDWFGAGQGPPQGCVLAPLLFNMLLTAILRVAVERFSANADVVKEMVCTKVKDEKEGGEEMTEGGRRKGEVNKPPETGAEPPPIWGMPYADDAGLVSRSRSSLAKMMADIVAVRSSFGLTVSEAKTETMCLMTKPMGKVIFVTVY